METPDREQRIFVCIPVRLESSRLPGKALKKVGNLTVLEHVIRSSFTGMFRAGLFMPRGPEKGIPFGQLLVATDSEEVRHVAENNYYANPVDDAAHDGFNKMEMARLRCVVSDEPFRNGTERTAACVSSLKMPCRDDDIVIIVQCDMVYIDPDIIADFIRFVQIKSRFDNAFFAATIGAGLTPDEHRNADRVKLMRYRNADAASLFFREGVDTDPDVLYEFLHVGIYAYSGSALQRYAFLPVSDAERALSLEQLRWAQNGRRYHVMYWKGKTPCPIDTERDLTEALAEEERLQTAQSCRRPCECAVSR